VRLPRALFLLATTTACTNDAASSLGETEAPTSSVGTGSASAPGDSSGSSSSIGGDESGNRYHPDGFAVAALHGPATKLHTEDCRQCHGADLTGGTSAVSCDGCHEPDWRTDCVFCHGGTTEPSGAPPRDLDDVTDSMLLSFIAHGRHVTQYQHAPYDCTQCHRKPLDVLSEGHLFDSTPAVAEVDFTGGMSPAAQWDGDGGCSSLYCHGGGLAPTGSYTHEQDTPTCGGCHPYPATANVAYASMSGEHARHMNEGLSCTECHDPLAITAHVDGKPDVAIAEAAVTFDAVAVRCTGLCHLRAHGNEAW
jgi:hypothetical protein